MRGNRSDHLGGPGHRLGRLLHQLRGLVGPSPEDLVAVELPRHQLRALFIVAAHGPMSVSRLADATGASLASTSALADRLVRSGHLERGPDAHDRRRVLLSATSQGQAVVSQLMRRVEQRFDRLVLAMSPEGRAALETGLTDMIRAAEGLGLRSEVDLQHDHGAHP